MFSSETLLASYPELVCIISKLPKYDFYLQLGIYSFEKSLPQIRCCL